MRAERRGRAALAALALLALAAPAVAQAPVREAEALAAARRAVREAFGSGAEASLSQPVLTLAQEASPIATAVPEPSSRTGGPVRFVLYSAGDTPSRLGRLTVRVDVRAPHLRVRERVTARAVIGEADVEARTGDIGRQPFTPLPGSGEVVGASARRSLMAGEVVTPAALVVRALVASGDEVVTVARDGGLEVRGRAIAAQAGGLGDTIIVVNPDSRRRLRGRVVGEDVVEVLHGS